MLFQANIGKTVEIDVYGKTYLRHAVQTHFILPQENYLDILKTYVSDIYQTGDLVIICEKIISLCQNRIIHRKDIKIGFWAKCLSFFADHKNKGGYGVGMSINMQYAINKVGVLKVLFASACSFITKIFGIKGVFYKIVGEQVSGLDGFYGAVWKEYEDIGIELPLNSNQVCNEIREKLGISTMIVDANDLGREILGKSKDIELSYDELKEIIRDNPAGQGRELTPFILIRKKN